MILNQRSECDGLEPDFQQPCAKQAARFRASVALNAASHPAPLFHRVWKYTQVQLHTSMATPEGATCKEQTWRGKQAGCSHMSEAVRRFDEV